jgi:hypothetical protein
VDSIAQCVKCLSKLDHASSNPVRDNERPLQCQNNMKLHDFQYLWGCFWNSICIQSNRYWRIFLAQIDLKYQFCAYSKINESTFLFRHYVHAFLNAYLKRLSNFAKFSQYKIRTSEFFNDDQILTNSRVFVFPKLHEKTHYIILINIREKNIFFLVHKTTASWSRKDKPTRIRRLKKNESKSCTDDWLNY